MVTAVVNEMKDLHEEHSRRENVQEKIMYTCKSLLFYSIQSCGLKKMKRIFMG